MTTRRRPAFSLVELLAVLAVIFLLAAVVLPSLGAFRGDTRQRAAADVIRGELAVARARAMEEGKPYRVALTPDGTRLRRAPDDPDFESRTAASEPAGSAVAVDYQFEFVTAQVTADQNGNKREAVNGWVTVASVQPDGTCREDTTLILIKEEDRPGLNIRVRGLTGTSRVVPQNGGTK